MPKNVFTKKQILKIVEDKKFTETLQLQLNVYENIKNIFMSVEVDSS